MRLSAHISSNCVFTHINGHPVQTSPPPPPTSVIFVQDTILVDSFDGPASLPPLHELQMHTYINILLCVHSPPPPFAPSTPPPPP
jgi:hypothetical protein